eukprot:3217802-Alexandrium_andersonii.AAC.1
MASQCIETINVTSLSTEWEHLCERVQGYTFVQEHTLANCKHALFEAKARTDGLKLALGPCDEAIGKPFAGVGTIAKAGLPLFQCEALTEEFEALRRAGRAQRVLIQLGG